MGTLYSRVLASQFSKQYPALTTTASILLVRLSTRFWNLAAEIFQRSTTGPLVRSETDVLVIWPGTLLRIPKVLNGFEVRGLQGPIKFFHTRAANNNYFHFGLVCWLILQSIKCWFFLSSENFTTSQSPKWRCSFCSINSPKPKHKVFHLLSKTSSKYSHENQQMSFCTKNYTPNETIIYCLIFFWLTDRLIEWSL